MDKLLKVLSQHKDFVSNDGQLIKDRVIDSAYRADKQLIELLLENTEIKKKFFSEIKGHWVFNINDFVMFVQDKHFLNDSYTKFGHKIGLTIDGKFLKQRGEVALVWPFKDTVLEGGMTKEDQKRKEIFFNEILAQDEIDKLFAPKVLKSWKRYTQKGEEEVRGLKRDENGTLKENLIIKGNNLLALHTLKEQFKGKVKLIYIDPPYYFKDNKAEDSFVYNSNFKFSTWLTFMKNRLEVARDFLSENGAIFIQIKDDGFAHLKILMDEVFGVENLVTLITVKASSESGVKVNAPKPVNTKEHILFYQKSSKFIYNKQFVADEKYDQNYSYYVENRNEKPSNWIIKNIKIAFKEQFNLEPSIEDLFVFQLKNKDKVFSVRDISNELKLMFKNNPNQFFVIEKENKKTILWKKGEIVFFENKVRVLDNKEVPSKYLSDIWTDISWDGIAGEGGVKLKGGKKPEKLIKRFIDISTQENDIVLDYYVGSGTTAAVAHKMKRQYIGMEQIDVQMGLSIERLNNVIKGDESGISKVVNWEGGGNFVYCELMKYNEDFVEQIENIKDTKSLLKVWGEMKEKAFFKHNFEMQEFEKYIGEFKKLDLEKQKQVLFDILDKNQLYVNYSEIEDKKFKVEKKDKEINKEFYAEK